ncbi:LOW QUALITY PROTEIN: uncharacterized protein LOC128970147 [Indicator indicator]|uniref:LOW QUALITY PROTEIN: uncharacterized protein LOC128970147 n=1 Tax=Indicator indicator TaxID=1002788 RepID=UPI0023DF71DD|nr:LOW QUALITY PROTEIN: uncharacterized protein LOC128970147 [Indicator indicator]
MDFEERLRQNNNRFLLSVSSILERYNQPFEDDLLISMETLTYDTVDGPKPWVEVSTKQLKKWKREIFKESPEISAMETSDIVMWEETDNLTDAENDTSVALVSRKYEDTHSQNLFGHDGKIPETVKVDPIVQDDARRIPKWMMVAPQASSIDLPLALPVQELSANTITTLRHPRHPELHKTCCDSILEDGQSGAEECSWSNLTLTDLYPVIVEIFRKRMTKHSQKKELKYMFGHLRYKRCCSRTSKLNVIVNKRRFRPLKMKQALPSICSSRSENIQNKTFESDNRELCDGSCSINDFSALVSCTGTNGNKVNYCDSSSEQHLVFRKSQKASQQPLDHIVRMGETFLAEDKLQTASLENSKCKQSENLAYKCSSECNFIASAASSGSAVVHLVNKSNTQHDLPCGDTSELCSSPYSSYGNRNTSKCFTSCYLARTSNTLLVGPKKVISEGKISFQCRNSFSSLSMKQRPSETAQKYEDAFEKLYHELSSKEIPKPLMFTRPHSNSQNPEEKGRLVKSNFGVSMKSESEFDRAFDRIMSSCVVILFQNCLGCREF